MTELAARTWIIIQALDDWLLRQPTLVAARKRAVFPVLLQWQQLADSLSRMLERLSLERRTSRAGHDSTDHGPGGHDDVANAVAGVLWKCDRVAAGRPMVDVNVQAFYAGRRPDPPPEPPRREPGRTRVSRQGWTPWW